MSNVVSFRVPNRVIVQPIPDEERYDLIGDQYPGEPIVYVVWISDNRGDHYQTFIATPSLDEAVQYSREKLGCSRPFVLGPHL